MKIFASTLTYELGKRLGITAAARAFGAQLTGAAATTIASARVMQLLREHGDVIVYHGAGTSLPKARSRAAHAALASEAELWCMVDDDVETDPETLGHLIAIAAAGRVAVLPCPIRGTANEAYTVNCLWDSALLQVRGGVATRAVRRGGCGLMVVPRSALQRVTDEYSGELGFVDDDDARKVALFQQLIIDDRWLGEDYSFSERLRAAGVEIVAPVEGHAVHDGALIDLARCAPT